MRSALTAYRPWFHAGPARTDSTEAASAAAGRVLGRFGVVRRCGPATRDQTLPGLHVIAAQGPLRLAGWHFASPPRGTAVSRDPESARLAAVAETVERYCSMAPANPDVLVRAQARDLGNLAIRPSAFALFSDDQHRRFTRLLRLTDETPVDWCWSFSLTRSQPVLVPAAFVFPDVAALPHNHFLPEHGSSGSGCHVSVLDAVLAGLREVLERDALTVAWHNGLPLTVLEADGTAAGELAAGPLASCGAQWKLFRVPTDSPLAVVMAVATSIDGEPCAAVGAACRHDPVEAATKALYEAAQTLILLRARPQAAPEAVRTYEDHATFYASNDGAELLEAHLVTGPDTEALECGPPLDARAELEVTVEGLRRVGLEVLVTELTTPDVADAGFRVVRVLVPGTLDMSGDPRLARLGAERLYQLPVRLGLRERPLAEDDLNLLPVPLA